MPHFIMYRTIDEKPDVTVHTVTEYIPAAKYRYWMAAVKSSENSYHLFGGTDGKQTLQLFSHEFSKLVSGDSGYVKFQPCVVEIDDLKKADKAVDMTAIHHIQIGSKYITVIEVKDLEYAEAIYAEGVSVKYQSLDKQNGVVQL